MLYDFVFYRFFLWLWKIKYIVVFLMYYSFIQLFFNVIALWQRFICIYSFIIGLRVLSGEGRRFTC